MLCYLFLHARHRYVDMHALMYVCKTPKPYTITYLRSVPPPCHLSQGGAVGAQHVGAKLFLSLRNGVSVTIVDADDSI